MLRARPLPACVLGLFLSVAVSAQTTFVWTGQGSDNKVLTAENWQGNAAPTGSGTENWVFPVISFSNYLQFYPEVNAALTVNDITFSHPTGYYGLSGTGPLTLVGDITTYEFAQLFLPIVLASGQHVFDTVFNVDASVYGALRVYSLLSGDGGITKTGDGSLYMSGSANYTGDTLLEDGVLIVSGNHPLGWGTVTLDGGDLQADAWGAFLPNNFLFGPSVLLVSDMTDGTFELGNSDGSYMRPLSGLTDVTFTLAGTTPVYLAGDMEDGDSGPTTYHFSGTGIGESGYYLLGYNSYTGGTVVNLGGVVIFSGSSSLPESGEVTIQSGGYAGLGTSYISPGTFINRIDALNSYGTIGFDDLTVEDDLDLSGLNFGISLGTRSSATLSGEITPPEGGGYNFMSSGRLFLTGNHGLTGARDVSSGSLLFSDRRGMLILGQEATNDYSGNTVANHAAIIFDQPGSLSANTNIVLLDGGYVGFTETSGFTVEDLANRITFQAGTPGVIGIDRHANIFDYESDIRVYEDSIDLGNLSSPVYLGTATNARLVGTIFTTDDDTDDYHFTGYDGGQLTVSSLLTGTRAVNVGLPGDANLFSSVTLDNEDNNFTGGIVLNSGVLFAPGAGALGSGPITADTQFSNSAVSLVTSGTVSNDIALENGTTLDVSLYDGPLELSGDISGSGSLAIRSLDSAEVTLGGNNSYSGGSIFGSRAQVTANSDTALGVGTVTLQEGATVHFNTSAPEIGSLLDGSAYIWEVDGYYQQDAAIIVGGGGPSSTLTINQQDWGFFDGAILEDNTTLSVVINGFGWLQIGGNNYDGNNPYPTYSGGTTINNGILVAGSSNALGTGPITLNGTYASLQTAAGVTLTNTILFGANGGTLRGSGTFLSPITVGENVILAPGSSPGILTFASGLTLAGGGSLNFEVQYANGGPGTGYDLVSISSGTLNITADSDTPFTIFLSSLNTFGGPGNVTDFSGSSNYSWMIFEGNSLGGIANFDPDSFVLDTYSFTNDLQGGTFSLSLGMNGSNPAIYLNFTAVPEPSTWTLLGVGLLAGLIARRRRA
jgi:autotransporter-associated beta strand protein